MNSHTFFGNVHKKVKTMPTINNIKGAKNIIMYFLHKLQNNYRNK